VDKDRKAICDIINNMLNGRDEDGVYPKAIAYDRLEALVHGARCEAIGWTHADACTDLDKGKDPRKKIVPEMLERAEVDLCTE